VYHLILVTVMLWFAYSPASIFAQGLYKWVDSRGVVHYSNTPTNSTAKTVDDALPPAANFQRPTPPVEPAQEAAKPPTGDSATPGNAPVEPSTEQGEGSTSSDSSALAPQSSAPVE